MKVVWFFIFSILPFDTSAEKLWEYDKNKVDIILNNGYNLEVVWESDYKLDKTIINKLIKKYDAK